MRRMPRWSLLLLVLSVLAFAGAAWALSTLSLTGPGEGAENIGDSVDFTWSLVPDVDVTSPDQVSYDLYVSKTLSDIESYDVELGMGSLDYDIEYTNYGPLDPASTYFWKVVAHTPSGDVEATSFFMTAADTGDLSLAKPTNGQTGVAPQNVEFGWTYDTGTPDPDDPGVTFDLYLSKSLQHIFDESSRVDDPQLRLYIPETGGYEVGLNLTGDLSHNTKYYWTVVVHLPSGDYTVYPHNFTTLAEASDPNLGGGCSAAPLGGLAAMVLLAGLALVKRRN
jgi:uncharacterized protein (TIGR03382 family)